jgi:hypothetical protein
MVAERTARTEMTVEKCMVVMMGDGSSFGFVVR